MTNKHLLAAAAVGLALVSCGDPDNDFVVDGGETGDDVADTVVDTDDAALDVDTDDDTGPVRCVPGTRRCLDTGVAAYEICTEDAEWETQSCEGDDICFEGECQGRICEPFTVEECVTCRTYIGCNGGGTAEGEFTVPLDRTCETVDGVAQFVSALCQPGSSRCAADDDRVVERCGECGQSWEFERDCFEDDSTTVCDIGTCISQCEFIRKRDTYIGCEYWAVDLDNAFVPGGTGYIDADGKPFAVVVANPSDELEAEVVFSTSAGEVATIVVSPGGLNALPLHTWDGPDDLEGTPMSDLQGTEITAQAFRIESSIPIIAYQFNPLDNEIVYSNDASLLFPTSSLGDEYWVMTRRQTFDSLKGYVTVIGVLEGETNVTVTLPPASPENPLVTLAGTDRRTGDDIPSMRGGETATFTLRQYDVLNIETNRPGADLTGTRVQADRQVAVFGGSEASNAPNDDSCVYRPSREDWVCEATRRTPDPVPCLNDDGDPDITRCSDYITCCADHLEHQMLPDFAWGRRFNATRSVPRGDEADSWRILASRDDTDVSLRGLPEIWPLPGMLPSLGSREFTLDAGEWVDFQSPVDFEIEATGPIMVGQFLQAEFAPYPRSIDAEQPPHEDAGTGDPAFILAVPAEQYRRDYTFLTPNAFEFDHVAITAPVGTSVRLDGEPIDADAFVSFGSGDFAVARITVEDGVHTVAADEPVGLMVHGYDSFVSYGYPGGLDLRHIDDGR